MIDPPRPRLSAAQVRVNQAQTPDITGIPLQRTVVIRARQLSQTDSGNISLDRN